MVAAGEAGETAAAALSEAGFGVDRVGAVDDATDRLKTAEAVVLGDPAEGTAADLTAAVPDDVPVVSLGESPATEWAVPRPVEGAELTRVVRLAERTHAYRAAVDDLYRRCRERAAAELEGDVPAALDREVTEARRRAERAFRDTRRLADRAPYDRLLGRLPSGDEPEFGALTAGFDADAADAASDGDDGAGGDAVDDATGRR